MQVKSALWMIFMFVGQMSLFGQYDSTYIESYDGYLVGRFLLNRKFTRVTIANDKRDYQIRYIPNKSFSAGLGASYKWATLNLTVGLYQPNSRRGKTRNFDLQVHKYGRKFTTDILLQLYSGFYLADRTLAPPDKDFYTRQDISVNTIGGSFQYIVNHRKFSYRAVFQQTEFQKKSAGSFLLGAEIYLGRFKGDSTIIPSQVNQGDLPETINKMRFIEFGPNAGYAYTWVYKKLYFTASASASLNASITQFFEDTGTSVRMGVSPNSFLRGSIGYNTKRWSINVLAITAGLHFPTFEDKTINVNSGRYRLNFIYRVLPSRKVKRSLRIIDKVEERIGG